MKKIVIMPGGFHPFHAGHYALYKAAEEKFPDGDIYVAATNDTKTRPFPFEIKKKLAQLAGVNPDQFVQVKSPFKAEEITQKYDPERDVLIFVRSEKDRSEQPKPGGTKKDGTPSYFQPYETDNLESFNKHAYIDYLPTIEFGPGIKSATEIRNSWPRLNDKQKLAMVMSLYPATQKNKKLAGVAVKMLDAGILDDSLTEQGVEEAYSDPLTELFDTKGGVRWRGSNWSYVYGNFTSSNGIKYRIQLSSPMYGPSELDPSSFFKDIDTSTALKAKYLEFDQIDETNTRKSGIEGTGAAAEVFGIVVNAILKYIKNNETSMIYFQAKEINRVRLYRSIIKMLLSRLPGWATKEVSGKKKSMLGNFAIYNSNLINDQQGVEEATLINDPEQGHLIVPDGGMGTWDEQSLLSNLTRKFSSMVEMIKEKRYSNLYHSLYEAGVVENMLKALVEYENFKEKQGKRPIAKGRSIDMSQVKESSVFTEGISDVIKSVMNKVKKGVKEVSLTKDIGQYILIAEKGYGDFYVKAYSKRNMHKPVGGAVFTSTDGGKTFYSDDTYVYDPHKRKGIATAMYNFAREHGLNIVPSSKQSPDGDKFTKSYFSNKNVKESTDYISEK